MITDKKFKEKTLGQIDLFKDAIQDSWHTIENMVECAKKRGYYTYIDSRFARIQVDDRYSMRLQEHICKELGIIYGLELAIRTLRRELD